MNIPLLWRVERRLPMTRIKLFVACVLHRLLRPFIGKGPRIVDRGGIRFKLDPAEATDFALLVAGAYQDHVLGSRYISLPSDGVVFDVGANIGGMTFRFARRVPMGHVYAFEPTHYAFAHLRENLSLNPDLTQCVTLVQSFVSAHSAARHALSAYSSWKIDGSASGGHPLHGGVTQSAEGIPSLTIDDFCSDRKIQRLDLLKIDTEGHECAVLQGARETLARFRPWVIFELGLYTLREQRVSLQDYFDVLSPLGYRWVNLKNGRPVTPENAEHEVPLRCTTDILASSLS